MPEMKDRDRKTKRKVNLVSSHSDNERDDGPLAVCIDTGIYKDDRDKIPSFTRYKPGAGQTLVYEDYYIPDVD